MDPNSATSEATQAQESASQQIGKVATQGEGTASPETTAQKLARGFAQIGGRMTSEATAPVQEQSQGEAATEDSAAQKPVAAQKPAAPEDTVARKPGAAEDTVAGKPGDEAADEDARDKGGDLSPEERRRRAEQSAGDRARHQQELEAEREAQERRRRAMLELDDELLGQEARRQIQVQAMREQVLAEVVPHVEAKVHQDTRVQMASEMLETIDDLELKQQVVSTSSQWQSPADFYAAYNRAVSERAVREFRTKELPALLEQARQAARNEAGAEWESMPLPQPDGGTPPPRQYRTPGERLQAGLQQIRQRR